MPVHFKGSSEYKTHYVPFHSIKSASFEPSPQQKAKAAGKGSEALGLTMEPQITRKKRSQGPPTTLSTDFNQYIETPSDDFALLGRNDKFSENVRYKAKSRSKSLPRDASPPKQQRLTKEGKENKAVPRLKSYEPPPVVDTSKFRQPVLQEVSTPLAPRKEKTEQAGISKELKQSKTVLKGKERPSRKQEFQESKKSKDDNLNANKMEAVKKTTIKDKQIIESMNEFSQTNMDKGVAISAPEAPSEYALKYKAGVAPPRPRRRVSEYSKAFTWKDRVASSPLLAAEQIIYNSNPAVAPFKADFPKSSEYAAQFKGYKLVTPHDVKDDQSASIPVTKKRSKVKRSKSMGALRPDKAPPAGSDALITPDNKRQTVESELQGTDLAERAPPIKHGQIRRQKSEYVSNFQSPSKYNVEKGAWRGADPPHLKQMVEPEAETKSAGESDDGKPMLSNWFAEVLELRRKAQEYKKRANGTHFSREHLVQLMAQQNEFWDQVSTARSSTSTLSALSLESGMEARRRKKAQEKDSKPASPKVDKQTDIVQQKQGLKDDVSLLAHEGSDEEPGKPDTEVDIHVEALRKGDKRPSQRRQQAWEDEEDVGSELTPVSQISQDEGDGRIPTPQLKQSASAARRHHFDRTTPLVGGSLLSSPPRSDLKPRRTGKRQVRSNVSRSWCVPAGTLADDGSTITSTQSYSPVAGQSVGKTYNVRHGTLSATPTFGSPSKDTHFLRDDEASTDRPLQTTFVDTPVKSIPVISDSSEIVSQARPSKPKKFDVGPTITEGVGQTYNKPISFGIDGGLLVPRTDPDDDVLSVSARSVASSCSLASEVYERAQKRTQEFWGKDGIASR